MRNEMEKAIVTMCKALAQIIAAHYVTTDRSTSRLLLALADYVETRK